MIHFILDHCSCMVTSDEVLKRPFVKNVARCEHENLAVVPATFRGKSK